MDNIFTPAQQDKVAQRWNKYYSDNKDKIAQRRKERRALQEKKPVDEEAVKRYYELEKEMAKLKPIVALWKLRQTLAAKKVAPPPAAPAPGLPALLLG